MTNDTIETQSDPLLYYQAVGFVRGQYLPSKDSFSQGILITEDGLMAPTNLLGAASFSLSKHKELLQESQIWIVYPRTKLQPPHLHFAVRAIRIPLPDEDLEAVYKTINCFKIRGLVTYINSEAGKFVVRVYRNVKPSEALENSKDDKPSEALENSKDDKPSEALSSLDDKSSEALENSKDDKPSEALSSLDDKPSEALENSKDDKPSEALSSLDDKPSEALENSKDDKRSKTLENSKNDKRSKTLENSKNDKPILLTLVGVMPKDAYGQFWELRVHREADQLVLTEGKFLAQVFKPKKKASKKRKGKKKKTKKPNANNSTS